jgi:hypothetical protein
MPANNVDLVLVVDASQSMEHCYEALCEHLDSLLAPLHQAAFNVRIGVLVASASTTKGSITHMLTFLRAGTMDGVRALYGPNPDASLFFTSNPAEVRKVLSGVEVSGNEDMLVALDIALDFPFRPAWETRRVVALFTDEPFDASASDGASLQKLPQVVEKLAERRVKLFLAAPACSKADELSCVDGAEWEVIDDNDAGLSGVNFAKLLAAMAKTISGTSLQAAGDDSPRPTYGQDKWVASKDKWVQTD